MNYNALRSGYIDYNYYPEHLQRSIEFYKTHWYSLNHCCLKKKLKSVTDSDIFD